MIELIDPIISSNKVDISTGLNVHYLEASKNNNNQPIALLLHGFPELSFSWRKIIPILACLLYTSPSPRDKRQSRMPSSA